MGKSCVKGGCFPLYSTVPKDEDDEDDERDVTHSESDVSGRQRSTGAVSGTQKWCIKQRVKYTIAANNNLHNHSPYVLTLATLTINIYHYTVHSSYYYL
jgi:hypothetical protein